MERSFCSGWSWKGWSESFIRPPTTAYRMPGCHIESRVAKYLMLAVGPALTGDRRMRRCQPVAPSSQRKEDNRKPRCDD